jgi:hypothetical protein
MPGLPPSSGALAVAAQMETLLNTGFPRIRWDDPKAWEAGLANLQKLILSEGGSFKDDWQGARVRLWGFTASSTQGLTMAARNWITQVREKAGQRIAGLS